MNCIKLHLSESCPGLGTAVIIYGIWNLERNPTTLHISSSHSLLLLPCVTVGPRLLCVIWLCQICWPGSDCMHYIFVIFVSHLGFFLLMPIFPQRSFPSPHHRKISMNTTVPACSPPLPLRPLWMGKLVVHATMTTRSSQFFNVGFE